MDDKQSGRNHECRVLIAGIGNGGCSAVVAMARQWKDGPPMAGINTDVQDLAKVEGMRRVQIGSQVMKGMGSGGDPRVGRRAAEADAETIRELFHDVHLVLLIVGLGGGVGTGAAPLVVEEARKAGALTLCFALMPFEFEGQRRMEHARHGLQALEDVADGVICLPNQRLVEMMEDRTNIAEAFRQSDAMLYRGVQAVWRVICRRGVINLDFADVRTLLQESTGPCVLGCAEGTGPDRIEMALKAIHDDPLLKHGQVMATANSYIVSIMGGQDLTLKDVDRLMKGIADLGRPNALAMTGVSCDPELQDKVYVAILAAESEAQDHPPVPAAEKGSPSSHAEAGGQKREDPKKMTQGTLFDEADQGRFKGIDPTIVEGNNLDIPTFIRRGIMIQKVRNSAL